MKDNTIYTSLPQGWKIYKGATNHPKGYRWITDGKSIFDKEHRYALMKVEA